MPHGGPDWGTTGPLGTVFTLEDMAELAVRLGSIDTFDRRGNVILLDDFEGGILKWLPNGQGVGWSVTWDSTHARNGAFSAKLVTRAQADYWVNISRYFSFPAVSRMGFEFSWTNEVFMRDVQIKVLLHSGTAQHEAAIKWLATDQFFYYHNNLGVFSITPYKLMFFNGVPVFHTIKVVVDFIEGKYVRLIANNFQYDLSALKYERTEFALTPRAYVAIQIRTDAAVNVVSYIDDVIITQNEP